MTSQKTIASRSIRPLRLRDTGILPLKYLFILLQKLNVQVQLGNLAQNVVRPVCLASHVVI